MALVRDGSVSTCSMSMISITGGASDTPMGTPDDRTREVIGAGSLDSSGNGSIYRLDNGMGNVKISLAAPMTPSSTCESEQDWEGKNKVMQVNYYVNGVGEENFMHATILGPGAARMKNLGFCTLRIRLHQGTVPNLARQVMAGFLRGRTKEGKSEYTTSALLCFHTDHQVEIMSCDPEFPLYKMEDVEILPILHLREMQRYASDEQLAQQMRIDIRCTQYLPSLERAAPVMNQTGKTTRCSGVPGLDTCHVAECTTACPQTCTLCTIS